MKGPQCIRKTGRRCLISRPPNAGLEISNTEHTTVIFLNHLLTRKRFPCDGSFSGTVHPGCRRQGSDEDQQRVGGAPRQGDALQVSAPGLQVKAEEGSGGRATRAHLGLHGGPFPVADPLLEAGQERRLGRPHVGHLVPLAHGSCGESPALPESTSRPRSGASQMTCARPRPQRGRSPGRWASTSSPSAKFKRAAILSGRDSGSRRDWEVGRGGGCHGAGLQK